MQVDQRPLADRIEVGVPSLAAFVARIIGNLPISIRRRVLQSAFNRARDAFNRGDLEVVFALFAPDVEYVPPPPLHKAGPLHGRAAVFDFWHGIFECYDENTIENLFLDEVSSGSFVRRARLRHRSVTLDETLDYTIIQTTVLEHGRVVRQVNVLDTPDVSHP
jgi:hypothetical protein